MLSHAPDTVHMQVAAVSDQQYEQGASIQTSSLELSVWPQRQQAPCMGSVHFEGFKGSNWQERRGHSGHKPRRQNTCTKQGFDGVGYDGPENGLMTL